MANHGLPVFEKIYQKQAYIHVFAISEGLFQRLLGNMQQIWLIDVISRVVGVVWGRSGL